MAGEREVARPRKRAEYELRFASAQARRGWTDLVATARSAATDSWDLLTRTPHETTPRNYPLRGDLATVVRHGRTFPRWQHKPTLRGDARIWFYVDGNVVYLEQVHTHHPNATKR